MKLSGLILLTLVPLFVLAKSDYRGPVNLVGATQDNKGDIESCLVSKSAKFNGVTYIVGHDQKGKNSLYKYSISGHHALNYEVSVADTTKNRVVKISHAYSENPEIKKMDDTLLDCAGLS